MTFSHKCNLLSCSGDNIPWFPRHIFITLGVSKKKPQGYRSQDGKPTKTWNDLLWILASVEGSITSFLIRSRINCGKTAQHAPPPPPPPPLPPPNLPSSFHVGVCVGYFYLPTHHSPSTVPHPFPSPSPSSKCQSHFYPKPEVWKCLSEQWFCPILSQTYKIACYLTWLH